MAEAPKTRESLLQTVKDKQQEYYELLPDWTIYTLDQELYCKQNIGFALFGPPVCVDGTDNDVKCTGNGVKCVEDDDNSDKNIAELIRFNSEDQKLIDKIYNLIITHGKMYMDNQDTIWVGIIYNIILPTEEQMKKSQENYFMANLPIFKIKHVKNKMYDIWYIDQTGRIYKSWMDYLETNTLPKCTMVVPKDGILDCMKEYISEESSTVSLDVLDSPACLIKNKILNGIDVATSVTGITAGIGLAASVAFMPVAPIVVFGALGVNLVTGAWSFGRSAHKLRDRSKHEESIGLDNMDAASAWLGIAGSTLGAATGGSSAFLSKAVQQGRNISMAAKVAYNASLIGSLAVNGVGTAFQFYNIYENVKKTGNVNFIDVATFAAHVLFFANSVVNMQTAKDLILSSQGKVIDDYKSGLSKARHRNAYNRMVRKIGERKLDKISENTEIIRRINMKGSTRKVVPTFSSTMGNARSTTKFGGHQFRLQWDINAIKINGFKIIDPMLFIQYILKRMQSDSEEFSEEQSNDSELDTVINEVSNTIDLNLNPRETGRIPTQEDIDLILTGQTGDRDVLKIVQDLLKITFDIATRSERISGFFTEILRLLYKYLCSNAWKHFEALCGRIKNCTLRKILSIIGDAIRQGIDSLINEMLDALNYYLQNKEDHICQIARNLVS